MQFIEVPIEVEAFNGIIQSGDIESITINPQSQQSFAMEFKDYFDPYSRLKKGSIGLMFGIKVGLDEAIPINVMKLGREKKFAL